MARQGYGKLSNGFHSNTKVLKLQRMRPSALGVYCMAISFCSDVLNDGVMSEDDVIYQLNATEEDIEALIKVGMFEHSDDGSYRIHDYLSHQSSREQVETRAEGARNRKRKQRSEADVTPESRGDETNVTSMSRRDNSNVTPESRGDSLTKNQEPITNNQKNSSNEEFSLPQTPSQAEGARRASRRGLSHRVRTVLADLSTQDRQTQGVRGLAEGTEENQQHVPDRQGVEVRRRPEPGTRLHAHPGELAGRRTLGRRPAAGQTRADRTPLAIGVEPFAGQPGRERGADSTLCGRGSRRKPITGRSTDMLTLKESTLVLAKIRVHHGNAAITDLEARTFHEELRADMTLGEALEAVKRLYAGNDSGRWYGSGDVNAMVRRMRNESKPSEAQIARECEARGLSADEAWMYRRQRMLGNGPEQAQRQALTMRNPFELPAAQPKPRSTASRCAGASRPGMASLGSMLGGA